MNSTSKYLASQLIDEKWKCSIHKSFYCHFLYLNLHTIRHKICSKCKLENQIPDREILSILELLQSSQEIPLFSTFPVLKDENTLLNLKCLQNLLDDLLSEHQTSFLSLISTKLSLFGATTELKQLCKQITQIGNIKEAILSSTENNEGQLHDLIVEHLQQSTTNSLKIESLIQRFSRIISKLDASVNQSTKEKIMNFLEQIRAFSSIKFKKLSFSSQKKLIFRISYYNHRTDNRDDENFISGLSQLTDLTSLDFKLFFFKEEEEVEKITSLSQALNEKKKNLIILNLNQTCCEISEQGITIFSFALSQLINLTSLQLNFSSNKIEGQKIKSLSEALSKLINLNSLSLNVSYIKIRKEGSELLFSAIGQLTNLISLNLELSNNQIGNEGAQFLSLALYQLINLNSLQLILSKNNISQSGVESLSSALISFINLTFLKLNLNVNEIDGEAVISLSSKLRQLTKLKSLFLYFYQNKIDEEGTIFLSQALSQLTSLSSLHFDLMNNKIGTEGMIFLSLALCQLTNLSILLLDIKENYIQDKGIQSISLALKKLTNLNSLEFDFSSPTDFRRYSMISSEIELEEDIDNRNKKIGNCIKDHGLLLFSSSLILLTNLNSLKLEFKNNQIRCKGVESLSQALAQLTSLNFLTINMSQNGIGNEGAESLSQALAQLTCLNYLIINLSQNRIGNEGAQSLSVALIQLINLNSLELKMQDNTIQAKGIESLSSAIISLPNINSLSLQTGWKKYYVYLKNSFSHYQSMRSKSELSKIISDIQQSDLPS